MLAVTPAAQEKLTDILDAQLTEGQVRVSVVRGPHGCVHGWRVDIEDHPKPDDVVYAFGKLQVVVEPGLTGALEGATIDYREDGADIGFTIEAADTSQHGGHEGCGHHH